MPAPVWLDCDPGHDDVLALFAAAHHADLVGVSAVSGNAPLEYTLHNALLACQLAGTSAPVYEGADRPLLQPARHAPHIHGDNGLGGPTLPDLTRTAAGGHAAVALIGASHESGGLHLVATGPLTNVALAMRLDPTFAGRLASLSIMGGATTVGNITPAAEFNIWADPEAARIVFGSGAAIVMAGLDVTHQFLIDRSRIRALREIGTRAASFSADLLGFFVDAYERTYGQAIGPLHDPVAVFAVTHPELFEQERRHVDVETAGELTRGMTVVDRRHGGMPKAPNVSVLTKIDDGRAFALLEEALGALP